ncbi:glycerol-3-phosphate 1-O-acyltransferase PlsY [Rugosibacter aromaticivorans]|uniref:glycerol-3-phosphate 1-O-acyltransferase PlsY n=1 Tax=Rugosibacter aromaticivorans TaxID=1565605 RepID=UPI0012275A6D|nr:glycerol-3-phosphate 1-O-acyltransferase PlsY [Rugosibacter aromaticivorans]TBR15520.1 MAG: glycerol-3-phosphate 1-O-acyltransferase [Rugosibacter sp.]
MNIGLACLLGYFLGSLPFAVIVSRIFGLADPRSFGSGNPGATNVLRSGNKFAALLTLLGDTAKGWLAMFIAAKVLSSPSGGASAAVITVAGVAAFLGHVFPVTLGFKGGKGVATALGVLLGFSLALGGWVVAVWVLVAAVTRYSSLAALAAAASAPFIAMLRHERIEIVLAVALMSVVLIYRHRSNIQKLRAGTESRLGAKRASQGRDESVDKESVDKESIDS